MLTVLCLLTGCRNSDERLMPMKLGQKWFYMARAGLQTLPDNLEVSQRVAMGDVEGFELTGDLGSSRLAWAHGRLVSDQMAGARFVPPLPILAPNEKEPTWRGWVLSSGRREPAKASVRHSSTKLEILGKPVETVLSEVDLKIANRTVQLLTWFEPGVGIVRQEQRTNGRMDLMLEYLGG